MANQLHEAVAESIVREGKDELILLSPKEREAEVNKILKAVSQKSDDELISFISSKKKDVSPELQGKIAEMETLKSRIGAVPGGEIEAIMGKQQEEADLQRMGIVTRRDLPTGSVEIGFSDSPAKAVKSELSKHFGKDVPVFSRGEDLLYLDPETNEVVKVNPTMLQNLGLSLPIAGDIAGTIGGGIAGAKLSKTPKGVIAGESAGAFVGASTGEFARLSIGKVMGAHDLTLAEMAKKSGFEGVKAGASTAVIGSLIATGKGVSNFLKGGIFTKDEAMKYGLNAKESEIILEEVNKILGRKGVKGTLGRMTDDVMIASKEAEVRRLSEHSQKFVERDLADQKALVEALDVITKPKAMTGGQEVVDIASKQVGKRVSQAKTVVAENVTQLEKKLSSIGKVSHELVGQPTRKIILAKSEAADQAQRAVWANLKKKHGFNEATESFGVKIPMGANIKGLSRILSRRSDTASTLITKRGSSKIFTKAKKPKPADLSDFNREISDLRSEIRAAYKGKQFGTPQTRDMQAALDAMVEDRRLALMKAGKGKLLKDIEAAEKATANFHKTYNRSVIGDLTKKTDDVFNIKSKDFVDKTLKGTDEEAKQLLSVIGDQPTLVALWKEGIADAYKRAAYKGNKFSREASTRFLRKNGDVLKEFFDPDELLKLESAGNLAEKVAKQNDQLKRIVASANKFGRGKLKSLDPNNLIKFATNNTGSFAKPSGQGVQSSIAKIKHIKGMTKNYPAAWKSFQDEFSTQLRKSSIDIKTGQINPSTLNKAVNEQEKEIIEIMGKDYFNNLVKVNKAVQMLGKKELKLVKDEAQQGIYQMVRAGAAPPLTRRGRAFTAVVIFESKRAHKVIADSLLEPGKIKKIAELSEHKRLTREAAELAVSLGFIGEDE